MSSSQRAWSRLVLVTVARAYRASLLTLVLVAVAPLLLGWSSFVIRSGSMEPGLAVGDVVVAQPLGGDAVVDVGRVCVFDDPTTADRLLVHRVVERRDDGTYTSAGDANEVTDTTAVERDAIHHQATLLAPLVGLPTTWFQEGRYLPLVAWALLTTALLAVSFRRVTRDDEEPSPGDGATGDGAVPTTPAGDAPPSTGPRAPVLVRLRGVAIASALVALVPVGVGQTASAAFTARTTNPGSSWVAGSAVQPYVAAVLADRPSLFWLLDEAGPAAGTADRSGNNRTGQPTAVAAYRQNGDGLPRNVGYSVQPGDTGRVVVNGNAVAAPSTFTLESWFTTTSTTGGLLMGFENSRNATSSQVDRQVYLDRLGRVVYGNWPASQSGIIQSPRAYNDGRWHHLAVVATLRPGNLRQDTTLYVDGVAVIAGSTSRLGSYTGWWRVGAGTRPTSGTNLPIIGGFRGLVDNVAVYDTELSAARVAAHHAAR